MDAARQAREAEKQELLTRVAELGIEEMVGQGVLLGTPHYSIIERYAITPGMPPRMSICPSPATQTQASLESAWSIHCLSDFCEKT